MFEFTGKLKALTIVLILIGAVSVGASFLMGGDAHHDDDHHTEAAHHGDESHHDDHATADDHGHAAEHAEEGDHAEAHGHGVTHVNGKRVEDHSAQTEDFTFHKTASRANPENNQFYKRKVNSHHDAEHIHHQQENKPWSNLMINTFFFLAVSLGALFFLAIQYAAQASWAIVVTRVMEAMASFLIIPVGIMLLLMVTGAMHIGGNHLWHWMAEGIMDPNSDNYDAIIAGKEGYLNNTFFIIRTIIYLIGWVGGAMLLRRMSLKMDAGADPIATWKKMRNWSAGFLVFFAVTSSMSAWDWIMSIDTHWFSTLFGWYVFAGMFVTALTVMTLLVIYLKGQGYLEVVNHNHLQDLAKFMFAFSVFWTYLWFSQFMLIWYSNIPEEVTYYMARFGEYKGLFFTMVIMNFLFPILVMMSRDSKRNQGFVITAGIIMIIGHWLDIFIMISPGTVGSQWSIGLVQLGTFLGFAGLFLFVVFRTLSKAPLTPEKHPMYLESKYFQI
jgi:hypothetical protein